MTNDKRIAQQILNIFEKTPGFYRYGDETESKYVDLAICANTPEEGISSYATIGLFQTNIGLTYNAKPLRIELLAAGAQSVESFDNIMATTAFEIMDAQTAFPGYVVNNVVSMYIPNREMRHILLTHPFLWDNTQSLTLPDLTVAWLMCIPISDQEKIYCEQNGLDALETIFEQHQIDIFDINRQSTL